MQVEQFGGPAPAQRGAPLEELLLGVGQLLRIFEARGFCTKVQCCPSIPAAIRAVSSGFFSCGSI